MSWAKKNGVAEPETRFCLRALPEKLASSHQLPSLSHRVQATLRPSVPLFIGLKGENKTQLDEVDFLKKGFVEAAV